MKTVKEMYEYSHDNDLKLLSDFDAAFWEEYKLNHARYDKVFSRLYSSFYYSHQEEDFTIDVIQSEFSEDVYNFLLINRKKYEELFRIYNLSDDDYKFDNNFSIKTVYSKNSSSSDTSNYGDKTDSISNSESLGTRTDSTSSTQNNSQRTDSYTDVIGTRNDTSSSTQNNSQRTDSYTDVIGARSDTSSSTQSNSERIDSYEDTIGSVNKTIDNKIGSQNNSHTNTVAAYNDETFFNKEKNTDSLGERTDKITEKTNERNDSGTKTTGASSIENSSSFNSGEQNNSGEKIKGSESIESSSTFNSGEQNNSGEKIKGSESIESTLEFTKGNQTNTNSSTIKKGSYVDSASHSSNENYTMEKSGLIGNKTSTSLIKEHEKYWNLYEFYNRIFSDICNEFLCI